MMESPPVSPERLRAALNKVIHTSPYVAWSGMELESCSQGEVVLRLDLRKEVTQHHGFLHGSIIGFLIDTGCAWAAGTVAGDVVTANYSVNMLAPGVAPSFRCEARVIKAGKKLLFCRAEVTGVTDTDETLIATGDSVIASVGRDLVGGFLP